MGLTLLSLPALPSGTPVPAREPEASGAFERPGELLQRSRSGNQKERNLDVVIGVESVELDRVRA